MSWKDWNCVELCQELSHYWRTMARNDVHHLRVGLAHYSLHWCSCRSCHGFRCIFIELWFVWFSSDSRLPFKKCHWRLFVIQQSTMCRKNECSLFIAAHTRASRSFNAHLRWFDHRTSGVCSRGNRVPKLEAVRPLAHILSPLRDVIRVVTCDDVTIGTRAHAS